jgi:hypothetical protein
MHMSRGLDERLSGPQGPASARLVILGIERQLTGLYQSDCRAGMTVPTREAVRGKHDLLHHSVLGLADLRSLAASVVVHDRDP